MFAAIRIYPFLWQFCTVKHLIFYNILRYIGSLCPNLWCLVSHHQLTYLFSWILASANFLDNYEFLFFIFLLNTLLKNLYLCLSLLGLLYQNTIVWMSLFLTDTYFSCFWRLGDLISGCLCGRVLGRGPFLGLQMSAFSLCPHTTEKELWFLLIRTLIPSLGSQTYDFI